MTILNELEAAIDLDYSPILSVRDYYRSLRKLKSFEITSFGPTAPDEKNVATTRVMTNGKKLQHASSNFNQGKWLTRLASLAVNQTNGSIQVVELGTCAGISAMYLLAGMAAGKGGHLTTFEGSNELADLSTKSIDQFILENQLNNVSYSIIVGSLDETLPDWIESIQAPVNLAFIDGNHQEDSTERYHCLISNKMNNDGIIVHDDIAWGNGMARAWQKIAELESNSEIVEFNLGGKASRGLIFLGRSRTKNRQIINTDGWIERTARSCKASLERMI